MEIDAPIAALDENRCSNLVIAAAIEVHRALGPGLLESAYQRALEHELRLRGLRLASQLRLPAIYKGVDLGDSYRIDLLVEELVVVEIKALDVLLPIHEAQLLTYLRHADKRLGLILNFNAPIMKSGIKRVANNLRETSKSDL